MGDVDHAITLPVEVLWALGAASPSCTLCSTQAFTTYLNTGNLLRDVAHSHWETGQQFKILSGCNWGH